VYARNASLRAGVAEFISFIRSAEGQKITDRF
jgi:hypothetical protein